MSTDSERKRINMGGAIYAGVMAGTNAAIFMLMAAMGFAVVMGQEKWAPVKMIAITFLDHSWLDRPGFQMVPILVGMTIHFATAIGFGAIFSLLGGRLSNKQAIGWGIVYGLAIWLFLFLLVLLIPFLYRKWRGERLGNDSHQASKSNHISMTQATEGQEISEDRSNKGGGKSFIAKWMILAFFLLGIGAFFYLDLGKFLTLNALKENRDALRSHAEAHYLSTVILYIVIYCFQTALSLPGATVLTLAGGFLFGAFLGTMYVNMAATSGATLAFLAARYLFRERVERKWGRQLEPIQAGFSQNAFSYLLTLRLIPLFPFFLINLASGLTRMRLRTYLIATAIGIIPGSFVYANAGRQIGAIDSLSEVGSPRVIGAFVLLGLLALLPVVYKKWRGKGITGAPVQEK
jgi:uncharacterized membrane protein YdjX (TVP38/TMEM64 family)